jgi:hypothetical protein
MTLRLINDGDTANAADINQYYDHLHGGLLTFDVVAGFGAVGDGVTDDTAAFQAALDAAGGTAHGSVVIPGGSGSAPLYGRQYKITSPLTIPNGVTFGGFGHGLGAPRLVYSGSGYCLNVTGTGDPASAAGMYDGIRIHDLYIDGTGATDATDAGGIKMYRVTRSTIERVYVSWSATSGTVGIRLDDWFSIAVRDCWTVSGGDGLLATATGVNSGQLHIENGLFQKALGYGIHIGQSTNVILDGVRVQTSGVGHCGIAGMRIGNYNYNVSVENCHIEWQDGLATDDCAHTHGTVGLLSEGTAGAGMSFCNNGLVDNVTGMKIDRPGTTFIDGNTFWKVVTGTTAIDITANAGRVTVGHQNFGTVTTPVANAGTLTSYLPAVNPTAALLPAAPRVGQMSWVSDGAYLADKSQLRVSDGTNWRYVPYLDTAARIYSGAGTPEAAVTAVVGSLFLRTDGGATTTLYVKTSGTGNTGWTAK